MNGLRISVSPHIHSPLTTRRIMLDVIISLLPVSVAGCIIFGIRALTVICACVAVCLISELLFNVICKKEQTAGDLSAIVTGLLLALNLPANIPLWQCAVGSVFAIVFVKCVFGGIGQNFANPAISARIFMTVAFSSLAGTAYPTIVDTAAGATPLSPLESGQTLDTAELLLGLHGGAIGETCSIALLAGAAYLLAKRIITPHAPLSMIATVFLCTLFGTSNAVIALQSIAAGGLLIGAFFMATDYTTTPITGKGKIIFGIGAGLITVLIRFFGSYPEGVSFGILFMNILTPYIDRWTAKKPFGGNVK